MEGWEADVEDAIGEGGRPMIDPQTLLSSGRRKRGRRLARRSGSIAPALAALLALAVWIGAAAPARGDESPLLLMFKGQALNNQGRYAEAAKILRRAVSLSPDETFGRNQLGLALAKLDQRAEAVAQFRQVLRLDPEDFFARAWIGVLKQNPIARLRPSAPKALSPQERLALTEEKRLLSRLSGGQGLNLRIGRVVIDPGHGGWDSGAKGPTGYMEKKATLDISRSLNRLLTRRGGVKSFLTRRGDYYLPLAERTTIANQYRADIFVSIHINSNNNRRANGTQTFFSSEKASSKEAARVAGRENAVAREEETFRARPGFVDIENILFRFERKLYWSDSERLASRFQRGTGGALGLKNRGVASANFFVLRNARMPAVLVEVSFISNPREEALLKTRSFRKKVAETIFSQIMSYRR